MPVPTRDSLLIEDGDVALYLHKDDESGGSDDGNCRMHADTERAMVSIGIDRVGVRHLRDSKQGQQNETHQGDRGQSRELCASIPFQMCLKCCQSEDPHLKNTQV
jgi:hypothetical protein